MVSARQVLKTGVKVNPIGLGCMGMSEFYGQADEKENIRVLERALELGCTFWDTADMYGVGRNEELLAKVLKTQRDKVFLCTKFGNVRGPNGEFLGVRGDPEYVKEACDKSLKRLGVEQIDLYYQHRVDPKVPIEDTVRAMAELVKEGKVKYLGLSECKAETLRRAHAIHPITAVQTEYSPWTLDVETNGVLETCKELGITFVAYSPLGRGFLTGRYKTPEDFEEGDFRKHNPRFQGENFQKNLDLADKFGALAKKKGVTASQLCLAWVLAQGDHIVTIPGTKRVKYLEENMLAENIELTAQELSEIRQILDSFQVSGTRYPSAAMQAVHA
ncbi:hypothetical protein BZG36_03876 [Bifiguratus adelaidae]|uniref:NADP-dependent oxidoreductase domain-containing protein n=1 Tax=Bifiguratus adelaidae TaxID=1938954 RepID=A0A261XXM6_9FUNG|nr:hypothetical protein BZG36_03876 [Bifiguratus adelaidae]